MNWSLRTPHRFYSKAFYRLICLVAIVLCMVLPADAGSPPAFKLKDLNGQWFNLKDHLGQEVIYITLWATWCNPCRREMPHLEKLYDDFADDGLLVVSINTDPAANKSKIKPFIKRYKLSYPIVLDPDNNVHDKYNPTRELPYAVLVDREGNVHKTYPGYRAGDEEILRKDIEQLLAAKADEGE